MECLLFHDTMQFGFCGIILQIRVSCRRVKHGHTIRRHAEMCYKGEIFNRFDWGYALFVTASAPTAFCIDRTIRHLTA